jgi:hypothetical protein
MRRAAAAMASGWRGSTRIPLPQVSTMSLGPPLSRASPTPSRRRPCASSTIRPSTRLASPAGRGRRRPVGGDEGQAGGGGLEQRQPERLVQRRVDEQAAAHAGRQDIDALDGDMAATMRDLLVLIDRYDLYGRIAYPSSGRWVLG